ncbi:MAG: GNAT family N-acetyltransferase [Candidatus Berkiella sp.]
MSNMIADYNKDKSLFGNCIGFLDEIFPGCKEFALKGIQYGASWPNSSIPFIVEEQGKIVAHIGILPLTITLNNNTHQTAAIHAVGVNPSHRRKGYFKLLMKEVITYVKQNFESSFLMTQKPYLFKNYPYTIMLPEYDFLLKESGFSSKKGGLRELNLDHSDDFALLNKLLSERLSLSNQFSILGKNAITLFILNSMHGKIGYSDRLNTMVLYQVIGGALYLREIVSQNEQKLSDIIETIPESFNKVILQFCPDRFLNENEYTAILARPENCVMVSPEFKFNGKYFRYPEVYSC